MASPCVVETRPNVSSRVTNLVKRLFRLWVCTLTGEPMISAMLICDTDVSASSLLRKTLTVEGSTWMVATRPRPADRKLQLRLDSAMPGGDSEISRQLRQDPEAALQMKSVFLFKRPYTLPSSIAVFSNHLKLRIGIVIRAPFRVHVSQADGRLLWWMYTLQFSLEWVAITKIAAALGTWLKWWLPFRD